MTHLRASMGSVALKLPDDPDLMQAAGGVALAHSQLELMLRMTIKTLAGLTVREALDATESSKNWELRKSITSIFRKKTKDPTLRLKLQALLKNCQRLSEKRNSLLHNAWAITGDGSLVTKGPDHAWGPAVTVDELVKLASDIADMVAKLNDERLKGFIQQICKASKDDAVATDS